MARYLTNMTKQPGLAELVAEASRRSGIDVRYHDHPMPADDPVWGDDDGYDPAHPAVANDCSLAYYGSGFDCSAFWREFEALRDAALPTAESKK